MSPHASQAAEPIVITGVGLLTCLGLTAEETWRNVAAGRCGIGAMPALEQTPAGGDKPGGNGGQVPELPADWMPGLPREVRYLRRAIDDALSQSGLTGNWLPAPRRCGCIMGTTLHGMRQGGEYLRTGNHKPLCGFLASHTLALSLRGLSVEGLSTTTCSACSSGLGAIALGVTLLRSGQLDLVIAGGYDPVSEYAYAGFDSMRLVAPGKLRPFCTGREGMKLSEGYAVVILERSRDAAARKAAALAEVRGIGESADAHHLTQPHPEGEGALRAIQEALHTAHLQPESIGLIAAHATATPNNDASEYAAFARAFGDGLPAIPAVAFKSHLGHTLGAAGGAELILSLMAMRARTAPATANITPAELEFERLSISDRPRPAVIDATLNTSLGFGGANTCVVLSRPRPALQAHTHAPREVFITGVGFLAPGIIGNEALNARLSLRGPVSPPMTGMLDEAAYGELLNARRVRRMSEYSKLTLAATSLALQHAGIADVPAFAENCSAILGTTHGSAMFCRDYYRQIVDDGMGAANPVLFAEGVPNAASAQLSLMLGIKGCCQTIIGSRTAGLDAMSLASHRIASGRWDRAIVGASEEDIDVLNAAYREAALRASDAGGSAFENERGFLTSCGAVTFILESRASLEQRGARPLARVGASAASRGDLREDGPRLIRELLGHIDDTRDVVSSANATWIDRVEAAGLESHAKHSSRLIRSTSLYGYVAELFSVGPMAAIAGGILGRSFPRLPSSVSLPRGVEPIGSSLNRFGVLATDYSGLVSVQAIELLP